QRGVLAVLVDPALQHLDHHLFAAHPAVLGGHRVEPLADAGFGSVRADKARQRAAGIRKQHVLDEGNAAGGALDIGQDRPGHQLPSGSRRGKRVAMSLPVKWPTQPSGSVKKRMATKLGSGPMSNQWVVASGTDTWSPASH